MVLDFNFDWEFNKHPIIGNAAIGIMNLLQGYLHQTPKEWVDMFPYFRKLWHAEIYYEDGLFIMIVYEKYHVSGTVSADVLTDNAVIELGRKIVKEVHFPTFAEIKTEFGTESFLFDKFTYVGPFKSNHLSFHHVQSVIMPYLETIVHPEVLRRNKERVLAAIPEPPSYDVAKIIENIYIIESPQGLQGTCFHLNNIGLITCAHSILEDSYVFKASQLNSKYSIKILRKNETIDLAVFEAPELALSNGLVQGNSDIVRLNDHIAVAGFPNHNFGDSGIFSPGLVIGFRPVSSILRILVNTPLIAGNSGGPIIDRKSEVIGVAVTGSDSMANSILTENHGVIPISAIKLL